MVIWHAGKPNEWIVEGTKKDADKFEARKRVELDASPRLSTRAAPTFADFASDAYEPHARQHLRAGTWHKVRQYEVATLDAFFGSIRLDALTAEDVDAYKAQRTAAGRRASSVNRELRVLRTMLNFARERGYPCADLKWKRLRQDERRVRAWSMPEVQRLLAAAQEVAPELVDLLAFMLNTGVRKTEAINVRPEWIDRKARLLRIPITDTFATKTGKARDVPLSDSSLALLTPTRMAQERLFMNTEGNVYAAFPEGRWRLVRAAAGVSGTAHSTRHTFASMFLQRVPDLPLLAEILGHSTTRTTELYRHLLPGHLSRGINAVDIASPTMAKTMAKRSKSSKSLTRH